MGLLIKNAHVVDPLTGRDGCCDVRLSGKKISEIGDDLPAKDSTVLDATGLYLLPGLIDLHVHLRDPGQTYKETLSTGSRAAAKGGFTTICAMPNTKPVIDSAAQIEEMQKRAEQEAVVRILQYGAVTKGQEGKELAEIAGMAKAGCPGISEDGQSVKDAGLYRQGMLEAKQAGILVLAHCEDKSLVAGGVMNADENAARLGLPGITNSVEDVIVARDILLAKETGATLHLCHCSTKDSVEMIRQAKAAGLPVTGEVCPHHFALTSDDIPADDGNYKMNPPIRSVQDRDALRAGLQDGTMDVISTDHAPHAPEEKNRSMKEAPFGIVGLETSAALTYTCLVQTGCLSMMGMAEKMSANPARILGLTDRGSVSEGRLADLTLFDPSPTYVIDKNTFVSKGKNTPFDGREVTGEVAMTIVGGQVVYQKGKPI